MDRVQKKQRRTHRHGRLILLGTTLLALAGVLALTLQMQDTPQDDSPAYISTAATLYGYEPEDVASVTIQRRGEDSWTLIRQADGLLALQGEGGFTLSEETSLERAGAAAIISCEEVLTDDPTDYAAHLSDFGLAEPRYTATITYADGVCVTMRVGDASAHSTATRYMLIDGDDRLFTISKGIVDELFVSRDSLWDVEQPTIHKARIDRITLYGPDDSVRQQWTLQGDIAADDAQDRWQITQPFVYAADSAAMANLLANASNLRLGSYVGPASEENLTAYGFDAPRQTIELHMAAGTIGTVNALGEYVTQDWPESTVTFIIGSEMNDMVDYVRHGDAIYLCSHFTMGVFMDIDARSTMSRYPLLTALGNLARLEVAENDQTTVYELTRTERVAENNELVYDENDQLVWDVTVTCNGQPVDYAAFEAAYSDLVKVSVSGMLPQGEKSLVPPHTTYTFHDTDGTVHTVALAAFDAMHDSVIVDGHEAFYLIRDGFRLTME